MASKHRFETEVYKEFFDLLKVAREAEDPWGGKKMDHAIWMHYMKKIVDRDMKLDELERETARLWREDGGLNASAAENHEQLRQLTVRLMELEWCSLFNGIKIRKAFEHVVSLKGTLMARYLA